MYILLLKLYIGSLLVLNLNEYVEEHHNISKSILLLIGSVYLPVAKVKGTNPFSTSPLLQLNRPLDPARLIECGEEEDQNKYDLKENSLVKDYFSSAPTYISVLTKRLELLQI